MSYIVILILLLCQDLMTLTSFYYNKDLTLHMVLYSAWRAREEEEKLFWLAPERSGGLNRYGNESRQHHSHSDI